jgi:predicted N-formylglutamate amidohydrolase
VGATAVLPAPLLEAGEPAAFSLEHAEGISDFVLVCDHAGHQIPRALGSLGLSTTQLASHIAWDIGAAGVARRLAQRLGAPLMLQRYSRLVIDCNRPLEAADSITAHSEWTRIRGNEDLPAEAVEARRREIFEPYHQALRDLLDARLRLRRPTLLVAIHSFTPSYRGEARPWHIGLMYRDARLAAPMLAQLRRDERLQVGDNQPYAIEDGSDYTLPVHGEARGLPYLGIELRQDLVANDSGQAAWAGRLAVMLRQAANAVAANAKEG